MQRKRTTGDILDIIPKLSFLTSQADAYFEARRILVFQHVCMDDSVIKVPSATLLFRSKSDFSDDH